ncbi:MAG: V-type ATP synthase subunit D [Eubacteriales bacterium]|nr:V-type ATP synthase subunit D [Eubacteriales bacterium]
MAIMQVNPTRMELSRLKKRLQTASRGHKLLKDKRDEMMRRFVMFVRENQELRRSVEAQVEAALKDFLMARSSLSAQALEEAVLYPSRKAEVAVERRNIMSVEVPGFTLSGEESGVIHPYGILDTSGELDQALLALNAALEQMVKLAEKEKACNMLADEIEKTRRRVNALEYVMIPQLEETISYITMKLEENERANLTRLMKVKTMLAEGK